MPADFDAEEFLRGAKMAYNRLQAAWDSRDLNDIAQFASPAVMDAVRQQLAEETEPSKTEILLVNAQLLSVVKITIAHKNGLGALVNQMACGELAHMTCTNNENIGCF